MAGIVQSDPYLALSRKIGYSVGLERLFRNVLAVVEHYSKHASFSYSDWRQLVLVELKRNERSVVEIANFFASLNLLRILGRELHIMPALDSLSILRRSIPDDDKFFKAVRVILLHQILEADGDIFLNCLGAGFDESRARKLIEEMVLKKWRALQSSIKTPGIQQRIWEIIAIRSMESSGAKGPGETGRFGRTLPNDAFTITRKAVAVDPSEGFSVPLSYMRHVLSPRKGWAMDLLLFVDDKVTDKGQRLFDEIEKIGLGKRPGPFIFWPYAEALAALRITAADIDAKPLSNWELLKAIAGSSAAQLAPYDATYDYDDLVERLRQFHQLYRTGSAARGMIRNQLPLYVAKPCLVGYCVALEIPVPDLPAFVEAEGKAQKRRLNVTNIRGTDGGLVFAH